MAPVRYVVTVVRVVERSSIHANAHGAYPLIEAEEHVYSQTVERIDLEAIICAVNEPLKAP